MKKYSVLRESSHWTEAVDSMTYALSIIQMKLKMSMHFF